MQPCSKSAVQIVLILSGRIYAAVFDFPEIVHLERLLFPVLEINAFFLFIFPITRNRIF